VIHPAPRSFDRLGIAEQLWVGAPNFKAALVGSRFGSVEADWSPFAASPACVIALKQKRASIFRVIARAIMLTV